MISHDDNATAVGAWAEADAVLSRIAWPDDAPRVSLVGGAVRDALLGVRHGPDIDLVVEGDAIALARAVGLQLGGSVIAHARFGTARIELPHGRHLDLVTARRETYVRPGALPDVEPGGLLDDLARRDFTVNAIAYVLHGGGTGGIIDPHDGRADITAHRIRAVRAGAFGEDPSRVVRALRYAARLGFCMDDATEAEARAAAPTVDLRSSRVADEAARMLAEDSAAIALALAQAVGVPWSDPDERRDDRLAALSSALAQPGAPAPAAWALRLGLGVRPGDVAAAAMAAWARGLAADV
ncbi:MAG: CCA tRNA nucleotidyltransferase, partial [Actinobacteria bacterium]|nr:CCA tRNA nucleotidyltransferase [Actinomycetota bacterium]